MGEKLKGLLKKPVFWIIVAAVALFAIIRSRMSAQGGQEQGAAPASFSPGGGGGGPAYGPEGSSIENQIMQQDLEAGKERLRQQAALFNFDLQQKQSAAGILEPLQRAWEKSQEAIANLNTATTQGEQGALKAKGLSCEGKGSFRIGIIPGSDPPRIGAFCREKTSGNFITTGIQKVVEGVFQGAAQAAPGITEAYLGQQFGAYGSSMKQRTGQGQSQRDTRQSYQVSGGSGVQPSGVSGGGFQVPSGLFPGMS